MQRLDATRLYMSGLALSAAIARLLMAQAGHLIDTGACRLTAGYVQRLAIQNEGVVPGDAAMGVVRKRMRASRVHWRRMSGPQVAAAPDWPSRSGAGPHIHHTSSTYK
jgi:hypothetical protein